MATLERKLNLSSQQRELVAVGASVGAGCQPCVSHHLDAGAEAGLDDERLLAAVASAERVSAEAAVLMGEHVRDKLARDVAPALLSRIEETLASLGAALGANDKRNIERQLKAASGLGVSRDQLREAIETARVVQENAARIHLREAERLLTSLGAAGSASADEGCGCGAADEPAAPTEEFPATEPDAGTSAGCGPAAGKTGPGGFAATVAAFCAPSGGPGGIGPAAAIGRCAGMFERGFPESTPLASTIVAPEAPPAGRPMQKGGLT